MKKFIKILLPLTMVLFLSACNTVIADNTPDHSGQTLTGVITSIDGTQVSLTLGKLKENDMSSQMMQDNMPAFENGEMPSFENGELPEMPEGEMPQFEQDQMPEMNNGQMPQGPHDMVPGGPGMPMQGTGEEGQMPSWNEGEAPELPEGEAQMTPGQMPPFENGEMPEMPSFENGEMPELPEGELPSFGNGQMMTGRGAQMKLTYTFKESEKTDAIDLKDCVVTLSDGTSGTFEDLKIGDVIRVIVSKENIVESVRVYQIENQEE